MSVRHSRSLRPSLMFLLLLVAGCAVAQHVQSRKCNVAAMKGAEVSGGGFARPIEHVGRIRVYASQDYRGQRAGWEARVTKMVDSTGEVPGPAFGVRLEVVETRAWNAECDPASLQECLDELAVLDPGEGVDWVVGLISSVPRFTESFDELGMAALPGRHFILRDLFAAAERQKHKRLVVFLHEWAHTLGGLDASLSGRFPFDPAYPTLREYLANTKSGDWFPGQREELLASLAGAGGQPVNSAEHAPPQIAVVGEQDKLLAGVSPEDRARYAKAQEQFDARHRAGREPIGRRG